MSGFLPYINTLFYVYS
jgi:hypothetical protein